MRENKSYIPKNIPEVFQAPNSPQKICLIKKPKKSQKNIDT